MAGAKKLKLPTVYSPAGIAKYAWLTKPDPYQGAEKFKATLLIDDTPEVRAWIAGLDAKAVEVAKENGIKLKKGFGNPFKLPEDQDDDDFVAQDGKDKPKLDEDYRDRVFFTAKSQFRPGVIGTVKNAEGGFEELPDGTFVMSGDIIRIRAQLLPYEAFGSGYSLRLVGAQLLKKRAFGGGAGNGWDDLPDGFGGDAADSMDDEIPF